MRVFRTANYLFFVVPIMAFAFSCSSDSPIQSGLNPLVFNKTEYNVTHLEYTERWFNYMFPISPEPNFPHDERGVILFYYNNNYYYHPYQVINQALWYLEGYRQTGDTVYLNLVYTYIDAMSRMGQRHHDGIYFPYEFDYRMHGEGSNDVLLGPWYSGFAQGFALALLSRTYELTANSAIKAKADSVFNTFNSSVTTSNAWTVMVDSAGYYWIEEYPFNPPTHVFNGFLMGIFGLYDYYMITGDSRCRELIKGSCTTVAHYFSQFRCPGGIVYYCLRHKMQDASYHQLVITELRYLSSIAGDSIFSDFADLLAADYNP